MSFLRSSIHFCLNSAILIDRDIHAAVRAAPAAIIIARIPLNAVGDFHATVIAATAAIITAIMIVGFSDFMPSSLICYFGSRRTGGQDRPASPCCQQELSARRASGAW